MHPEFWRDRWREGAIGFHEGAPNAYLVEHVAKLTGRVLVPLCGKTEDLAFLAAQGHEVIGIELVEDAVRAFFAEHGVTPTITPRGAVTHYNAGTITLIAADVFAVTRDDVGAIDSIYDRAALVALPPELRTRYVAHLGALVPPETPVLLITLEYAEGQLEGPPFAVRDAEVRERYRSVELLGEGPATAGRLAEAKAVERCYRAAVRTGPASSAHSS